MLQIGLLRLVATVALGVMPVEVVNLQESGNAAQVQSETSPACELHLWPADDIKAVTQGWILNHVVDQTFDASRSDVAKPEVLAPARQAELLAAQDWNALLKFPPGRVITHSEPLGRSEASAKQRHASSSSSCYREFAVSQLFYDDAPIAGRSLRALMIYRDFGSDSVPQSTFSTWAETRLKLFPADKEEEAGAADAELVNAYRSNLRTFARYALAPPPNRKKAARGRQVMKRIGEIPPAHLVRSGQHRPAR